MRFVSLFAGVGGFDLGLERAGHECIGQVEIDSRCRDVLSRHWPSVSRHDDVQTAKEWADEQGLKGRVDLVCGGFPCQDVSVAGRRAGLAGARTGLFFDALAFATHVEAETLILENVPGLLSSNNGRDFGVVLSSLADAGYRDIEWRVLDSQFFGVPQRRRRVFIVASTRSRGGRQVLAEREGGRGNPEAGGAAWEGSSRAPEKRTAASGALVGALQARDFKGPGNQYVEENKLVVLGTGKEIANTIPASLYHHGSVVNQDADNGHLVVSAFRKSKRAQTDQDDETWVPDDFTNTVNAFDVGDTRATELIVEAVVPTMGFMHNAGIDIQAGVELTPAIKVGGQPSAMYTGDGDVPESAVIRRLTPTECERLQGFPDGWTAGQSDSARYKQMGNAVTVNVIEFIGRRLEQ